MATHSSILAWKIPWTEEPGGLQPTGSQRVGHNGAYLHLHTRQVWKDTQKFQTFIDCVWGWGDNDCLPDAK